MPKLGKRLPKYRKHKASGQAIVTLDGSDHYLGEYDSKQSHAAYEQLIAQWLASGRQLLVRPSNTSPLTIQELVERYHAHEVAIRDSAARTAQPAVSVHPSVQALKDCFGECEVNQFGPMALKSLRQRFVVNGNSRRYVNDNVSRIRRVFRWGVSDELVAEQTHRRLLTVDGLRRGQTEAPDPQGVQSVDDDTVLATLPGLQPTVGDMVRIQRLTGSRPIEVCLMRPKDIEACDSIWLYTPHQHKTERHEKKRVIVIGPNAHAILRPYLDREGNAYCFNPKEVVMQQRRKRHAERVTPLSCGCKPHPHARNGRRPAGEHYTTTSYRRAIHRACDRVFVPPEALRQRDGESKRQWLNRLTTAELSELRAWQSQHRWSPNQLRHTMGTKTRERFGIEAVAASLGHARTDTSEIYAERNLQLAIQVATELG